MELDTDYIKENANTSVGMGAPAGAAITTIDPHGDLMLDLGDVTLLVSSKVLSVASPVFRTMFGPNFKEGESLAQSKPISLKGDDADVMTKLCAILHFQGDLPNSAEMGNPNALIKLARKADKYDCLEAIWPTVSIWLDVLCQSLDTKSDSDELYPLLETAYRLDHPQVFTRVTKRLLLHDEGALWKRIEKYSPDNIIPLKVYCDLQKERLRVVRDIENGLQQVIIHLVSKQGYEPTKTMENREYGAINHTYHKFNMHDCVVVSAFLRELRRIDLWGSPLGTRRISALLERFHEFEHFESSQRLGFAPFAKQSGCPACMLDAQSRMAVLYQTILEGCSGLCLDCVFKGQYPEQERECRVAHR